MQTHIDDPLLLAFSDGELGFRSYVRVRTHLFLCAECRNQLADIAAKSLWISQSLPNPSLKESQIEAAKDRFFARLAETDIPFDSPDRSKSTLLHRFAFGVALLVCVSAFAVWRAGVPSERSPVLTNPKAAARSALPLHNPAADRPAAPPAKIVTAQPQLIVESPSVTASDSFDADALEVQLLFALHETGSCLGEQVELRRDRDRIFLVVGMVPSVTRREEIMRRVSEIVGPMPVQFAISTVEESPNEHRLPADSDVVDHLRSPESSRYSGSDALALLLRNQNSGKSSAELQSQISEVSNAAVRGMNAVLTDAWALEHLSRRFPRARREGLSPASNALITQMTKDHLDRLQSGVMGVVRLIDSGDPGDEKAPGHGETECIDWNARISEILDTVRGAHERALQLFAPAGTVPACSSNCLDQFRTELTRLLALAVRCSQ